MPRMIVWRAVQFCSVAYDYIDGNKLLANLYQCNAFGIDIYPLFRLRYLSYNHLWIVEV